MIMGIISLPVIIFFIFWLVKGQNGQYNDEEMIVHERAVNLSKDIGSALLSRLTALGDIGFSYNEVSQDGQLRSQLIQHFLASRDEVTDIAVVDNRGREVVHKREMTASGAVPLVDRSQNIEFLSLKDKGYYIGPLYISQGKPVLLLGKQIISSDGKATRGAVFALLKADFIIAELKQAATQEGMAAFIVNEKGVVVAHGTFSYISEAKDFSHNPAVESALGGDTAPARIYTNELTERVVGTGIPLVLSSDAHTDIQTNWFVILETPAALALSAALAGRNSAVLVLLVLLACAAAAAVVLAPRIGTPLDAVIRALKELNAGNVDYRLYPSDRDDLKAVTMGVNTLADTLKRVMHELSEEKHAVSAERGTLSLALSEVSDHERFLEKVKADFVAITAHELRTPLTEVKWAMSLLLGKGLGALSAKQKNLLKRSVDSNEYMIRLVDDLLETAVIETGQFHYALESVDMKKVVGDLVLMRAKEIERKGVSLAFKKPRGKVPLVSADEAAMKIAVNNVLENAIAYTPKGGKITVSLAARDSRVEVHVADTGIGVLPEDTERVFAKFFRGKNALNVVTDGTGLGLYIAKKIVEAHGGHMSIVESRIGTGSHFSMSIPVEQA